MIFDKSAKTVQQENNSLSTKDAGTTEQPHAKKEMLRPLCHTIYKNYIKMDKRPKL